jgi:hypothetical protein
MEQFAQKIGYPTNEHDNGTIYVLYHYLQLFDVMNMDGG